MYNLLIKKNIPKQNIIKYCRDDIKDESIFLQKEIDPWTNNFIN